MNVPTVKPMNESNTIREGVQVPVDYTIVGPVIHGEIFNGIPLDNTRRNLWFARPTHFVGHTIVVCVDGLTKGEPT